MGTMEAGAGVGGSECEKMYKQYGNSVQYLLVMSIGLTNKKGRELADFDDDPIYKAYLQKSLQPRVPLMKAEMRRRAVQSGLTKFRKNSVLKPEAIMQWLKENPVKNPADVTFLIRTEDELYKTLTAAAAEAEEANREKLVNSNWVGNLPWLRLYCSMVHDDAMKLLPAKDLTYRRDELDAGANSNLRPMTYEAVVARVYNDPDIVFYTDINPELHVSYDESIELHFHSMPGGEIDGEDVKKKIGDARAKLMQVRYCTVGVSLC
jgi:hypothetical protein